MMRPKNWLPGVLTKPKNFHSLEHLKYLHAVLCKHPTVTENNRSLLVESMRSISEILIWGDQNDGTVFDFFLEKNMLSFFLSYLQQRYGRYICVQILQTLNILFENIRNETSLYYLLSNNHINSIIVHKFDFSDEEVMAYFISFLKTLSLKLNKHTIHFFYNEHTHDFALYTEAIKFFNHSESMVRIAVRTITLNVYKVGDNAMLRYIRDKTAAPYFCNLVWFIGVHVLDLDCCVRNDADHMSRVRLEDLVAEHLDHLHYINDILNINIDLLNDILTDHLLHRLFIPLYVYSMSRFNQHHTDDRKHVSSVLALFLLAQVFLIISHVSLVRQLARVIIHGDIDQSTFDGIDSFPRASIRAFSVAHEPSTPLDSPKHESENISKSVEKLKSQITSETKTVLASSSTSSDSVSNFEFSNIVLASNNVTDEDKMRSLQNDSNFISMNLSCRPFLEATFQSLDCIDNDYSCLFSLCLLHALRNNPGMNQDLMDSVFMQPNNSEAHRSYNVLLIERLIAVITAACDSGRRIRLVTLELAIKLLKQLVYKSGQSLLWDQHLAAVEHAREASTLMLRQLYKGNEIFLDMFEDEYVEVKAKPLNVEYLMMDASMLLSPTGTPLTGIDFTKRLPCGEEERCRKAIRVFFMIRDLSLTLLNEEETYLPLTKDENFVKIDDVLDLNNSDLIACTVITRDSRKSERRFLVIDVQQLILVEPDTKRLGWGVVRFVGPLQDVLVTGDKDDSRSLHATIHKPSRTAHSQPNPLLSAKFVFDDHIRCMAAMQRLTKRRSSLRSRKLQLVERLLDLCRPMGAVTTRISPSSSVSLVPGRSHSVQYIQSSPSRIGRRETTSHPLQSHSYTANFCQIVENNSKSSIAQDSDKFSKLSKDAKVQDVKGRSTSPSLGDASSHTVRQVNSPVIPFHFWVKNIPRDSIPLTARYRSDSHEFNIKNGARVRSHSHSPLRNSRCEPRERSKSQTDQQYQDSLRTAIGQRINTVSTGTQTKKSVFPSGHRPSPKTLQPALTPTVSLIQDSDRSLESVFTESTPKLMPPSTNSSTANEMLLPGESSMNSQIKELAQLVQHHYNYDSTDADL